MVNGNEAAVDNERQPSVCSPALTLVLQAAKRPPDCIQTLLGPSRDWSKSANSGLLWQMLQSLAAETETPPPPPPRRIFNPYAAIMDLFSEALS